MVSQTAEQERDWWDALNDADAAGNACHAPAQECAAVIVQALRDVHSMVLELGCGPGRMLKAMAAAQPDWYLYGADISPQMVRRARIATIDLPRVHVYDAINGRRLYNHHRDPGAGYDEVFSAAYSIGVFQHLPGDAVQGWLREIALVLRPGGRFVFQFVARLNGDEEPDGFLHYKYRPSDMMRWCAEAGFAEVSLEVGRLEPEWDWITATKGAHT